MSYRISAVAIRDYKRINEVNISPAADSTLILIGGENAQGKSSILDALEAALGGKDAVLADPVRHGAESAEIRISLAADDGGPPLTARRRVAPDGSSTLELRDDLGAVKSPQALLDKLIGARFLDPLRWLRLDAGEQRKRLLELVDRDGEIAKLDARHARLYARRTEVAREVKRTAGALASAGPAAEAPPPIDVSALSAELQQIGDQMRDLDRAVSLRQTAIDAAERAAAAVESARVALARAVDAHAAAEQAVRDADAAVLPVDRRAIDQRRGEIQVKIGQAVAYNGAVAKVQVSEERRRQLAAEHEGHAATHIQIEAEMASIDEAKRARLAAAALPVDGLGITEAGITYRGALLANASGAQRMHVAIALAAAAQPQLRDVWIRDGAIISAQSLAEIAEMARAAGIRLWVERVETRDPGAIEIRDGRVVEHPAVQGRLFDDEAH